MFITIIPGMPLLFHLVITINNQDLLIFIKAKNQVLLYEDSFNKRSANDLETLTYDFLEGYKETLKIDEPTTTFQYKRIMNLLKQVTK